MVHILSYYYYSLLLLFFIAFLGLEKHLRDTKVYIINTTFILFLHVQSQ